MVKTRNVLDPEGIGTNVVLSDSSVVLFETKDGVLCLVDYSYMPHATPAPVRYLRCEQSLCADYITRTVVDRAYSGAQKTALSRRSTADLSKHSHCSSPQQNEDLEPLYLVPVAV